MIKNCNFSDKTSITVFTVILSYLPCLLQYNGWKELWSTRKQWCSYLYWHKLLNQKNAIFHHTAITYNRQIDFILNWKDRACLNFCFSFIRPYFPCKQSKFQQGFCIFWRACKLFPKVHMLDRLLSIVELKKRIFEGPLTSKITVNGVTTRSSFWLHKQNID